MPISSNLLIKLYALPEEQRDYLIDAGWIEALKWVLGLTKEKVYTEGKNTLIVKEKE